MNYCPVYRKIGGHSYPWIYPGPIGTVLTGANLGAEVARDVASACTLCNACRDVCPVKIELPELILCLIVEITRRGSRDRSERARQDFWSA